MNIKDKKNSILTLNEFPPKNISKMEKVANKKSPRVENHNEILDKWTTSSKRNNRVIYTKKGQPINNDEFSF